MMQLLTPRRCLAYVAALLVLPVLLCRADDKSIFDFNRNRAATKAAATQSATQSATPTESGTKDAARRLVATSMWLAADDFVVDIYVNGKIVPSDRRALKAEIYGAQVEQVTVDLHEGDWVVFNVACNQLRWGGSHYFGCAAVRDDGRLAFQSEAQSGRWLACDDLPDVPRFVAERDAGAERKATAVEHPWKRGDQELLKRVPTYTGEGVWGTGHGPWIKYVVKGD